MIDAQIMIVILMLPIIMIVMVVFIFMTDARDKVEKSCTRDEDNNNFTGSIQREIDSLKIHPLTPRSYYALVILGGIKHQLLSSIIDEFNRRLSQPAYMANLPYWRIEQMYFWDYEMMMERYDNKFNAKCGLES